MNRVFADTSYYIALCNPDDAWNVAAIEAGSKCRAHIFTTEYVIVELGNYYCGPKDRALFLGLLDGLQVDNFTTILPASERVFDGGLTLYRNRPDKSWSLTDCISFFVMKDLGVRDVLACDRHFVQAGFTSLVTCE